MIKVSLYQKKFDNKTNESTRTLLDSKEFSKPKSYEEFISSLSKAFKLKKKDIILNAYTTDEDENLIQDQQDLEENEEETVEYRIILEKDESPSSEPRKKIIQEDDQPSQTTKIEKNKKIEEPNNDDGTEGGNDDGDDEGDGLDIKLDVNLDISDKELEDIITSQIKQIPEIDKEIINDDIQFDVEKYKEEMNNKYENIKNGFKSTFDSKINDIVLNKSNIMKSKINDSLIEFSQISSNNLEKIKNEAQGMSEESNNLLENTEGMKIAMAELRNSMTLQRKRQNNNNIVEEDDNNNDRKTIRFTNKELNLEYDEKKAKFMEIPNIEIENVGNESYKKLFFVRDESSSEDFIFIENNKNINFHQLSLNGEFSPDSKESHQVNLRINNPKPNKTYTLIIFVKEDPKKEKLSGAFKFNIKIKGNEGTSQRVEIKKKEDEEKEKEDEKKLMEEKAKSLYEQYNNKYDLSLISNEEEAIKKIKGLNNDENEIETWIKNEFEKKNKNLYEELNLNNICDENEAKEKFKQFKYNKDEINEWIKQKKEENDNKKAEDIYNKLNNALNFSENIEKDECLQKIKDFEFDEEKINKWIQEKIKKPEPNPGPGPVPEDPRFQEMVDKFDEEYNILTIIEEDEFKEQIIKLEYDEGKIREYIEKKLAE